MQGSLQEGKRKMDCGEGQKGRNQVYRMHNTKLALLRDRLELGQLTMAFVDDHDLVFQINSECLAGGLLQKKVVRKGYELC